MGADQNLIRAAAQMGPKPFDYSGIMTAIANIGKFMAVKNSVAQEVLSQGRSMFKAVPSEIFEGKYGEANLEFMTNKKNQYAAAHQTMKKAFPGSKKYKQALRTVNNIKTILENNKAGLIKWEEIRDRAESGDLLNQMSKGNGSVSHNRVLDITTNAATGSLNENIVFTDSGILFYDDEMDMNVSINDLLNGYKEKSPYLDNASKDIIKVINKYGKAPAEGEKPLDMDDAKAEIDAILEEAGSTANGGFNSVRSLAYDFTYGGQSYVTSQSDSILQMTDAEFAAANPAPLTDDDRLMMKQNLLADAYGGVNATGEATNKKLKAGLQGWLYGLVQSKYESTESTVKEGETGSVETATNRHVKRSEAKIFAEIAKGEKGSKERNFSYGGIEHDYKNINGKFVFRNNYGDNQTMQPVQGNGSSIKDGSGEALYNQINGVQFGTTFEFLLLPKYNQDNE